jgi:DNA polymerase I-like protein with 3'-5' exonuclease and polymerase domains
MKDRFSTLVQGTASYAFDVWVGLIRNQGVKITAQFHDEFVARVVEGDEQKMYGVVQEAMLDCNDILDLNRQLDFECKFGKYYSEIH